MQKALAALVEKLREEHDTDASPGTWTEVGRLSISDRLMIGSTQFAGLMLRDGGREEGPGSVASLCPRPAADVAVWIEQGRGKQIMSLAIAFLGSKIEVEEESPYLSTQEELLVFDRGAALEAWRFGGSAAAARVSSKSPMPDQVAKAYTALDKEGLRFVQMPWGRLYQGVTDAQLARASSLVQKIHPDLSMTFLTTQMQHEVPRLLSKTPVALLTRETDKAPWAVALTPAPQWGSHWRAHAVSDQVWIVDFQAEVETPAFERRTPKTAIPKKTASKPKTATLAKKKKTATLTKKKR